MYTVFDSPGEQGQEELNWQMNSQNADASLYARKKYNEAETQYYKSMAEDEDWKAKIELVNKIGKRFLASVVEAEGVYHQLAKTF